MSNLDRGKQTGLVCFGWSNPNDKLEWLDRNRSHQLGPEENLMLAVLEDAIKCYLHGIRLTCSYRKEENQARLMQETEDWIFEDNPEYAFSSDTICEALGISVSRLRKELKGKKGGVI